MEENSSNFIRVLQDLPADTISKTETFSSISNTGFVQVDECRTENSTALIATLFILILALVLCIFIL